MQSSSTDTGAVVVGVDPSDSAREAAEWGADVAAAWGAPLHLVHVLADAPPGAAPPSETPRWLGELQDAAERTGVDPCAAQIIAGVPVDVLAARSDDARMLVIGSYGEGARSGMLAGSAALDLVGRATCPVAVVRGAAPQLPPPRSGPVVVGVDGSPAGHAALEFAAGLAASLGARLVALHTWSAVVAGPHGEARRRTEDEELLAAEGAALLEAELEGITTAHPGLAVERDLVGDTPLRALLDRSREARMLVAGHRGHQTGAGMLLGSTSRALVEFAPCPVVVTRPAVVPGGAVPAGSAGATS